MANTILVLTLHRNGSTSDTSGTVLLVDVTFHIATARNFHVHHVRGSAFTFVIESGHIVGVTIDVVGQRSIGVGGGVDVVHLGAANHLEVHAVGGTVDVVGTIGTVGNSVPVQDNVFIVEDGLVFSIEVLRDVQVSGEAPDFASGFAACIALVDTPEVVRVVEQVGHSVAIGKVARPVDEDVFAIVGAAITHTILSGIGVKLPTQGDAGRLHFILAIGRHRVGGHFRARHVLGVDRDLEVGGRRRSNQVVGARNHGQVLDDGAGAVFKHGDVAAAVGLHNDVRAGSLAAGQVVARGFHIIRSTVRVEVAHAIEARVVGLPLD